MFKHTIVIIIGFTLTSCATVAEQSTKTVDASTSVLPARHHVTNQDTNQATTASAANNRHNALISDFDYLALKLEFIKLD
ncbi:hypothetical protein, partial [Shewanella sairae]